MNFPFFIAKRYLVSKKKQNLINIITWISIAGIVLGAMAIVIIVSVLNGFNDLLSRFYSSFDPDLKIIPVTGKFFNPAEHDFQAVKNHPDVVQYAEVLEEMALIKYGKQIAPGIVKGVPPNFNQYTGIDSLIYDGTYKLKEKGIDYAVIGRGLAYNLQIGVNFVEHLRLYVPKRGQQVSLNPSRSINHNYIYPGGIFAILDDIDSRYLLVSFDYASELFEIEDEVSAVELQLRSGVNQEKTQEEIQALLGELFHVKNRIEQHDLIFKTMKSEKLWVIIILLFILVLSSGNMIGNLTLLFIDKKEDMVMLQTMGASTASIRRIFLFEGWLITAFGTIIGCLAGIFLCWIQMKFELISFPGPEGTFAVSGYPVKLIFSDILLALFSVSAIGFLVSFYPVRMISKRYLIS